MSTPTIKVEVGFQTTAAFGDQFILNNDPQGKLDTGGGLGGIQFVDVTSKVAAITINRGRNRQTESFNAGTAQVTFRDPQRDFDPLNTASVYYPYIAPMQPICIYADGIQQFGGFITDWDLAYDFTEDGDVTTVSCADPFTILANQSLAAFTPSAESSGDRIQAILTRPEIEYASAYAIDTGQSTLGAYAVAEGTNALSYLQLVTSSEYGWLFCASDGTLTFLNRHTLLNPTPDIAFRDDGTELPYQSIENLFGEELLYNSIQMQSPAGAVQAVQDDNSIGLYQARQYSKLDLLNSTTAEVLSLANAFLGFHKDPLVRFSGISVQLSGLNVTQQADILTADLVDTADVTKTFSTGTPSSVTQRVVISGISHRITPGSHVVNLTFESLDQQAYLTLDAIQLGKLDENLLAF